jgi:DnaK suppressor protein
MCIRPASVTLVPCPAQGDFRKSAEMDNQPLDLDYFRAVLLKQREALEAVAETGNEAAKPVELDQTRVGRLSRMDALQGQAMSQEAKQRREQALRQIGLALRRMDDDEYGYCQTCGEDIPAARLAVDPAATYCVACADKMEQV